MTSIIKVNTIQDAGGNVLLTSNGSGTLTTNNIGGENTPAFEAYLGSDQTLSDATETKLQINTESFDTNSAYDNSTNYRFTVPSGEGGKYQVYATARADADSQKFNSMYIAIKKNGSYYPGGTVPRLAMGNNQADVLSLSISQTFTLSASDYIELYLWCDVVGGSSNPIVQGDATWFGAYKLIGV